MTFLLRYWKPLAITAAILLAYTYGHNSGSDAAGTRCEAVANKALAESAAEETAAVERARALERDSAERINRLAEAYETDKRNAEESATATIDGLRAGNIKLRQHWQGCQATARVSGAATAAGGAEGQDGLRHESLQRVLGWVGKLQAQRDALIDLAEAERK